MGNFHFEVRVPLLTTKPLRELVTRMIAPGRQGLFVLPPSYRKLLAIVGAKTLEIDESRHAAAQLEHFGRHGFIPVSLLLKPRAKEDYQHDSGPFSNLMPGRRPTMEPVPDATHRRAKR